MMTPTAMASRMLKLCFKRLRERAGTLDEVAAFCRVRNSQLARYGSISAADAECFAPIDVVRDLEVLVGEPIVTSMLCQIMGGTFVALPEAPATREDLLSLLGRQALEQSQLTQAICAGLADGDFSPADAAKALTELEDVIRVAAAMRAELKTIVEGQ